MLEAQPHAERREPFGGGIDGEVRAADLVAEVDQHFGDADMPAPPMPTKWIRLTLCFIWRVPCSAPQPAALHQACRARAPALPSRAAAGDRASGSAPQAVPR